MTEEEMAEFKAPGRRRPQEARKRASRPRTPRLTIRARHSDRSEESLFRLVLPSRAVRFCTRQPACRTGRDLLPLFFCKESSPARSQDEALGTSFRFAPGAKEKSWARNNPELTSNVSFSARFLPRSLPLSCALARHRSPISPTRPRTNSVILFPGSCPPALAETRIKATPARAGPPRRAGISPIPSATKI